MANSQRPRRSGRVRIGCVSLYLHRKSWWIYFRERGVPRRRRVGDNWDEARAVGAQVNADLARQQPTMLSFQSVTPQELRDRWLDYHEHVLRSSLSTIDRYRTATRYLATFASEVQPIRHAHDLQPETFVRWLRSVKVAPNGHPHTHKRTLRDKGIKFILGSCRSMYTYAQKHRLMPPYFENPFSQLGIERLPVEDAKPIHVFTADEEAKFLAACDDWQFPIFYTLAKVGLRSGELTHLLVEDVDMGAGILHIRNKPQLGWQIKTRNTRSIPLPAEPLAVLRRAIRDQKAGVVFRRRRFDEGGIRSLAGKPSRQLADEIATRVESSENDNSRSSRSMFARIAGSAWTDAGAIDTDDIRNAFIKIARCIGLSEVTCPKCWRHTFATLLQEAGVDPLIRQQTMGHVPAGAGRGALGMTAVYTHTQVEFHRQQLQRVTDLRPRTTHIVSRFLSQRQGGQS